MILIFDSHPVQYKAPIYQRLWKIRPGSFRVVYATDATMRGHRDREFQTAVSWDTPLLEGYDHLILHQENGTPLSGFRSLTGRGIFALLQRERPRAALLSQFLYAFDLAVYLSCLRLRIPIWIRHETQDEAFRRPAWKSALRNLFYRLAYAGIDHAFYIGALNREHLLRHGLKENRLSRAAYCTPVSAGADAARQAKTRLEIRRRFDVNEDEILLLFSGKLIEKKNPRLILEAMGRLSSHERPRFKLIFVGAGPLDAGLRAEAEKFPGRIKFAGFVNQSEIPNYYAAADILLLPSRRAGETWGLVVNEALAAGCGVIMTRAVGCHREFEGWERVRVIAEGDTAGCTAALLDLARYPRSFDWCAEGMKAYSVEAAAEAIARQMDTLCAS
jgi:glycosyltransferase involved in cell wall biosynthesis